MDQTFKKLFYSPQGYWRGESAVDRLHEKTGADKSLLGSAKKAGRLANIFTRTTLRTQTYNVAIRIGRTNNASNGRFVFTLGPR